MKTRTSWEFRLCPAEELQSERYIRGAATKTRVIWRQPLAWEHCDLFVDTLKILKARYGRALVDVIPTQRGQLYLWGNRLSTPEICDEARRKLREQSP